VRIGTLLFGEREKKVTQQETQNPPTEQKEK